jgi:hypothetical protein
MAKPWAKDTSSVSELTMQLALTISIGTAILDMVATLTIPSVENFAGIRRRSSLASRLSTTAML